MSRDDVRPGRVDPARGARQIIQQAIEAELATLLSSRPLPVDRCSSLGVPAPSYMYSVATSFPGAIMEVFQHRRPLVGALAALPRLGAQALLCYAAPLVDASTSRVNSRSGSAFATSDFGQGWLARIATGEVAIFGLD